MATAKKRASFTTIIAHDAEEMGDLLKQSDAADVAVVFRQDDQLLILAKGRAAGWCSAIPFATSVYMGGMVSVKVTLYPENASFVASLQSAESAGTATDTTTVQ